jgi:E3 ubiquitin-protein ligase CCNP1IP1
MQLTNPDDVVVATLNPTEDYKTSVLSGLNPNVIMECAGRALNFWAYQTMQEMLDMEFHWIRALLTCPQRLPRIPCQELN